MRQLLLFGTLLTLPGLCSAQSTPLPRQAAGLTASLPWVNNFSYFDEELRQSATRSGFVGVGAAAFYRAGKNKFSLNFRLTGALPVPIGPFDYGKEGTRTNIVATLLEDLYHRKVLEQVNIMAGLNQVRYRFDFISYVDSLPSNSGYDRTLGLTIGNEYRFSKNASAALRYRPAVFSLDRGWISAPAFIGCQV